MNASQRCQDLHPWRHLGKRYILYSAKFQSIQAQSIQAYSAISIYNRNDKVHTSTVHFQFYQAQPAAPCTDATCPSAKACVIISQHRSWVWGECRNNWCQQQQQQQTTNRTRTTQKLKAVKVGIIAWWFVPNSSIYTSWPKLLSERLKAS